VAETNVNISITTNGASQARQALDQAAEGLQGISTKHDQMAGRFQQRFEHIGLRLFAQDALRANGLGGESRMMLSTLSMALSSLGSGPALLAAAGLGTLVGILIKVHEHAKNAADSILKNIDANNKLSTSYAESIKIVDDYIKAGGKATKFLADYKKAQEDAKKATDEQTMAMEKQTVQAIQQNIEKLKDQIREQGDLNQSAKLTTQGIINQQAGIYAMSNAYSQLGKDALPGLNKQLLDANANLKTHQGNIEALKSGYTTLNAELKQLTDGLSNLDKQGPKFWDDTFTAAEHSGKMQKKQLEEIKKIGEDAYHSVTKAFSDGVAKMMVEGKSLTETFQNMFKQMAEQVISDIIRMEIEMAVFRSMSIGGGGGFGGFGNVFMGATGTDQLVTSPTMFIAGEAGPEYVSITSPGNIGHTGGGGGTSVGNVTVHVHGINDPRAIADKVGQAILERIRGRGDLSFARA